MVWSVGVDRVLIRVLKCLNSKNAFTGWLLTGSGSSAPHTLSGTIPPTLSLSLTHTQYLSRTHRLSLTLPLSPVLSHARSGSLSLARSHTNTLSLSLPPSLSLSFSVSVSLSIYIYIKIHTSFPHFLSIYPCIYLSVSLSVSVSLSRTTRAVHLKHPGTKRSVRAPQGTLFARKRILNFGK